METLEKRVLVCFKLIEWKSGICVLVCLNWLSGNLEFVFSMFKWLSGNSGMCVLVGLNWLSGNYGMCVLVCLNWLSGKLWNVCFSTFKLVEWKPRMCVLVCLNG